MITESQALYSGFLTASALCFSFISGYFFSSSIFGKKLQTKDVTLAVLAKERGEAVQKYLDLTDNLAAAVVIRNAEGKITYCSPFTEVLTGYARTEIYECEDDFFLTICHEDDKERLYRSLQITGMAGEPFHFHFQFYHKSGIRMWGETRTVPILDNDGEVKATLSITFDITAAILYQKQIEEKNRELKDFTSMVSHDLKAPVFTMKGMIQLLKEDFFDVLGASGQEVLEHMERAGARLEQLISAVLEYSRIGSKEISLEAVPLDEVLQEVLSDHQHLIQTKKAEIKIETLPVVLGDRFSLSQIFSNLVGNALKYSKDGVVPRITISSSERGLPHLMNIRVADNGLGIPDDKHEAVFRPFVRLHEEKAEGTGIGLATVRKLLEKMSGQIRIEKSNPSEGTTFCVTLREG